MNVDENVWTYLQNHLGYSDEEMKTFKSNPRNEKVIVSGAALMDKTIVAEVVESHGCNSGHHVGDKFYMDGAGNLLSKMCPSRMCIHALSSIQPLVFTANELVYAGVDPNEMLFKRCGCVDVGLQCGGWGKVVLEIRMEDRSRQSPK